MWVLPIQIGICGWKDPAIKRDQDHGFRHRSEESFYRENCCRFPLKFWNLTEPFREIHVSFNGRDCEVCCSEDLEDPLALYLRNEGVLSSQNKGIFIGWEYSRLLCGA